MRNLLTAILLVVTLLAGGCAATAPEQAVPDQSLLPWENLVPGVWYLNLPNEAGTVYASQTENGGITLYVSLTCPTGAKNESVIFLFKTGPSGFGLGCNTSYVIDVRMDPVHYQQFIDSLFVRMKKNPLERRGAEDSTKRQF
jgi:hypothetical protein